MTSPMPGASAARLPLGFRIWASGALVSQLGDAVMYFALAWAASAHGGAAAGLVLSAVSLPRTALLLLGGVAGDRFGARAVMIAGDAVMLAVCTALGVLAWRQSLPLAALVVAAGLIGTVDAFYLPSAGSMARRLVSDGQLSRAVAVRQTGSQLVSMAGGPAGGLLIGMAGLTGAAWADAATFAAVLTALVVIRGHRHAALPGRASGSAAAAGSPPPRGVLGDAAEGVRVALRTPGLAPALLLTGVAAGCVIPVGSLLVPLLAREHGWGAGGAGIIAGVQATGTVLVMLVVARRGVILRPGTAAAAGLLGAAAGSAIIASAPGPVAAAGGALCLGISVGAFVSHLSPVLLGAAPRTHLARVQSLVSLVQSTTLLAANNLLGAAAHAFGAAGALAGCSAVLALSAIAGYASPAIRGLAAPATATPPLSRASAQPRLRSAGGRQRRT